jgi:hypothetical protein
MGLKGKKMSDAQRELKDEELFPDALIKWAGHRDGGVRLPFNSSSGRPTGKQISTPLVKRLASWAADVVLDSEQPRIVMLVGGPGNGKTDAIEGCIYSLEESLGTNCGLVEWFAEAYRVEEKSVPPRKVTISLDRLNLDSNRVSFSSISLVQDATEGDSNLGLSAEVLLLEDLQEAIKEGSSELYLCCVNRGILASAARHATENTKYQAVSPIIGKVTESVTNKPGAPACWPLEDYSEIAVWPMDVESLVVFESGNDSKSVAHEVFETLLDESRWKEPCDLGSRCPFCQNRKLLNRKGSQDNLINLLHYYELQSGKRWSFRDLFSLIAYLLVGDYTELEIRGKRVTPCAWSEAQYKLSKDQTKNTAEKDRASYLLASRLYHHRLFPNWPRFDSGDYRKAKQELLKGGVEDQGLKFARALFRFTVSASALSSRASGDVPDRVRESLAPGLDPAVSEGGGILFSKEGHDYSISDIESLFSISVREGLATVGTQIETLERDLLSQLALADDSLTEDKFPRNKTKQARLLQSTLRQFSARLVKRSLGVKSGLCSNYVQLGQYASTLKDRGNLNEVRKELRKLLHDENGNFKAHLATTFGQPIAERSRDVALLLKKSISIKPSMQSETSTRPADPLPYLLVEGHYVGLTFDLYKSLDDVFHGLHPASLPSDIYALLDRVKSLVSGSVVRDEDVLSDDPVIVIGNSDLEIEYIGGKFSIAQGGL